MSKREAKDKNRPSFLRQKDDRDIGPKILDPSFDPLLNGKICIRPNLRVNFFQIIGFHDEVDEK